MALAAGLRELLAGTLNAGEREQAYQLLARAERVSAREALLRRQLRAERRAYKRREKDHLINLLGPEEGRKRLRENLAYFGHGRPGGLAWDRNGREHRCPDRALADLRRAPRAAPPDQRSLIRAEPKTGSDLPGARILSIWQGDTP